MVEKNKNLTHLSDSCCGLSAYGTQIALFTLTPFFLADNPSFFILLTILFNRRCAREVYVDYERRSHVLLGNNYCEIHRRIWHFSIVKILLKVQSRRLIGRAERMIRDSVH